MNGKDEREIEDEGFTVVLYKRDGDEMCMNCKVGGWHSAFDCTWCQDEAAVVAAVTGFIRREGHVDDVMVIRGHLLTVGGPRNLFQACGSEIPKVEEASSELAARLRLATEARLAAIAQEVHEMALRAEQEKQALVRRKTEESERAELARLMAKYKEA